MVDCSSPIALDIVSTPTGPPLNFSIIDKSKFTKIFLNVPKKICFIGIIVINIICYIKLYVASSFS